MDSKPKQSKRRENVLSSLNVIIEGLNIAESLSSITPAKAVFSTVSVILTMIRDSMINEEDYVDLGLACNTVCTALDRGLKGKRLSELGDSVVDAINQLTTALADIRSKLAKRSKQNVVLRAFHAKNDSQTIASWRADLNRILLVFNTELGLNIYTTVSNIQDGVTKTSTVAENTQAMVSDIHGKLLGSQNQTSTPGELPPPPPRACFGRDELIDRIVDLAVNPKPIALIGAGGIGKTSIALKVLHHDRVKRRFGDDRRFIRCDQFPSSCSHLLSRLSKVIGAGVENPEGLASLRPFLSSKKMLIVLDNAESILDPEGASASEIYDIVEELSQFDNIWLCVTSRISTIPSACETLDIPTLSIAAARDAFHCIYKNVERSDLLDKILDQLDFHPLSIILLATVAHQNKWNTDRLAKEWEGQRTRMLQTMHNKSLSATIELSLSSPMFQELGPDARELLGVVAFFPQGVDENNLDWLFPSISNGTNVFDKFCILSLTYRNASFIMMLAPLRDHLRPKDPLSSPLLRMTKERYFTRMSVNIDPNDPGFQESRWITSEDMNVEHLLDVFTTIDANSDSTWCACTNFICHLAWHKKRLTILGPKIKGLLDAHRSKPSCLFWLSDLFYFVGNHMERRKILTHTLALWRERGDDREVAQTLKLLSETNWRIGLHEEGIKQVEEASQIFKQLGDVMGEAQCSKALALLLESTKQFDTAEEAASHAINLFSKNGDQYQVCVSHRILGCIYQSKGETEKAIHHYEAALEIASSFDRFDELFWSHLELAELFLAKSRFDDAQAHIGRATSHVADNKYYLGWVTQMQARLWCEQHKLEEARSEASQAADVFEKLGAASNLQSCRELIRWIEEEMDEPVIPDNLADSERVTRS